MTTFKLPLYVELTPDKFTRTTDYIREIYEANDRDVDRTTAALAVAVKDRPELAACLLENGARVAVSECGGSPWENPDFSIN